ncbi:DNA-directed RNA polymerase subunit epsilon [Halovenus halobia]|uniref:DNA-directed RNA polymerase subunit epsilon n=1 Tax=Halovenus halobia TaxID=3396622 RepID=UPI003F551CB8
MGKERIQAREQSGASENEADTNIEETPKQVPSAQQLRDHQPDAYTTGYDSAGETRVGVGTADGKVERLVRLNEGRHHSDGDHSAREAARDKKRITESFCSSLDVTAYKQHRAVSAMSQMNLDRFGQQKRIEKVALCTIGIVVDRERRRWFLAGQDPTDFDFSQVSADDFPDRCSQDTDFQDLCSENGLSEDDHYSITQLVKEELDRIGYFDRENGPLR